MGSLTPFVRSVNSHPPFYVRASAPLSCYPARKIRASLGDQQLAQPFYFLLTYGFAETSFLDCDSPVSRYISAARRASAFALCKAAGLDVRRPILVDRLLRMIEA